MINSIKLTTLFILFYLLSSTVLASDKFLSGYIIKANGDTISGLIKYQNWKINPEIIKFKESGEAQVEILGLKDLKGFKVGKKLYHKAQFQVETSPRAYGELEVSHEYNLKEVEGFLEVLFRGPKSLLYYHPANGNENYYIKSPDGKYEILFYKRYLKSAISQEIKEKKRFIGQLTLYLDDCPGINQKLQLTDYTRISLSKLFETYYKEMNSDLEFEQRWEKMKFDVGVSAGVNFSKYIFSSENLVFLEETDFDWSAAPVFGISTDAYFPSSLNGLIWTNELMFTQIRSNGDNHSAAIENNRNLYHNSSLSYSFIKLNTMIKFLISNKGFKPYLDLGFTGGYLLKGESNRKDFRIVTDELANEVDLFEKSDLRNYEYGFIGGVGGQWKNYSLETRMELSSGWSNMIFTNFKVPKVYLLFTYSFK